MGEAEKPRASAKAVTDANTINPDAPYFGRDAEYWSHDDWKTEARIQEALSWSETQSALAFERKAEEAHQRAAQADRAARSAHQQARKRFRSG